jgi:hypothetical protein
MYVSALVSLLANQLSNAEEFEKIIAFIYIAANYVNQFFDILLAFDI